MLTTSTVDFGIAHPKPVPPPDAISGIEIEAVPDNSLAVFLLEYNSSLNSLPLIAEELPVDVAMLMLLVGNCCIRTSLFRFSSNSYLNSTHCLVTWAHSSDSCEITRCLFISIESKFNLQSIPINRART